MRWRQLRSRTREYDDQIESSERRLIPRWVVGWRTSVRKYICAAEMHSTSNMMPEQAGTGVRLAALAQ
jgi:hypothetical protein